MKGRKITARKVSPSANTSVHPGDTLFKFSLWMTDELVIFSAKNQECFMVGRNGGSFPITALIHHKFLKPSGCAPVAK